MSDKLAKLVAAKHLSRIKTASSGRGPEKQVLPKPNTSVSEMWFRDWDGRQGVWQSDYDPKDYEDKQPESRLEIRLRTATGEEHTRSVILTFSQEEMGYVISRVVGAKGIEGMPDVGHSLHTLLGWIGSDDYSERAVRLGNIHDPDADPWRSHLNQNVRYRLISRVISSTNVLPVAIAGDFSL